MILSGSPLKDNHMCFIARVSTKAMARAITDDITDAHARITAGAMARMATDVGIGLHRC